MKTRRTILIVFAAGLMAAPLSCRPKSEHQLTVAGSTSVQPFMELVAEVYNARNPGAGALVQGGGSTVGVQSVREGTAAIGMCSRELNDQEKDLTPIVIAHDGIAIIVSPANNVSTLTRQQARDIFAGKIADWGEVGGAKGKIWVVTREPGSGTRGAFQELLLKDARISEGALVQDSNGSVREIIAEFPAGIGYVSSGLVDESVKGVSLDGVPPTPENVRNGTYSLVRPFLLLVKGTPSAAAQKFIDFVLSEEGQKMLEDEHLTRAKP
jgi:phosphate transport system substrate-binding protein